MKTKVEEDFLQKLIKLTFPIALQNLMLALVATADALMLGNVAQDMMSAVSLATQIQFIQNMILGSAISATTILGAQYWGKGDKETLNKFFCMSLRLCTFTSIVFFVLCEFFPRPLMKIFTNEESLIKIGIDYLKIAAWSYLLTGISQSYLALFKISDKAKTTAIISSSVVILNIFLNAVFIYGLFGVTAFNTKGAAIATVISRIIELFVCIVFSYKKNYIHPHFKNLFLHQKDLTFDFAKCALPILGASLFWGIGFTSYTAFMGHLGVDTAAANSVASVIRDLVCCLCNGFAASGGIVIGNELGCANLEKAKKYGNYLVKIAFLLGFFCTILMFAITPLVIKFVKMSQNATSLLVGMMFIMAIYMIGRTVNTIIINGIFSAGGDTLFDLYSLAIMMWGLAVPLAALGTFVFNWHPLVVYACTCLDEVGKIPLVFIHYKKYKWVKDLTR